MVIFSIFFLTKTAHSLRYVRIFVGKNNGKRNCQKVRIFLSHYLAMAMQRFFEFFKRKNYGALWNNLFNFFHLRSSAMRVKFSQTYKKNNFFIWGRLFSSSSLNMLLITRFQRIEEVFIKNSPCIFKNARRVFYLLRNEA